MKILIFNAPKVYKDFNSDILGVKFCLSVSITDLRIDACVSSDAFRFDDKKTTKIRRRYT